MNNSKQTIHGVVKCTERPHGTTGIGQNRKSLYRFHPDTDGAPPNMVVPYKVIASSFSKAKRDLFAVVCVGAHNSSAPVRATLQQVFGTVGDYDAYVAYQLSRHAIAPSIARFTKNVRRAMDDVAAGDGGNAPLEDRTDRHVITIDPAGCKDADDAMGAVEWTDSVTGNAHGTIISTYITHVPHTLDRLGVWENIDPSSPFRVATTYLPDHNLPMLPRPLSEWECSLVVGSVSRPCLAMDLYVTTDGQVARVEFVECVVRISHNYTYESSEMLADPVYRKIRDEVGRMNRTVRLVDTVDDSHDVVEWLMLRMNCEAGRRLYAAGRGIFRSVVVKQDVGGECFSKKVQEFITIYRNTTASYELAEDDLGHGLVGCGEDYYLQQRTRYAQITSPIRRFVDLINMTVLCDVINGGVENTRVHTDRFLTKPFIEHLNQKMRGIRRVQNDVALVAFGIENEGIVVDGVVVDADETRIGELDRKITAFVVCVGGGKSFSVPVRADTKVLVGSTIRLKVVSLQSKSTAYQKTRLSVIV